MANRSAARVVILCAGFVVAFTTLENGQTATFEWNNAAGGSWAEASNWTLNSSAGTAPPGAGDIAEFDLPAVYQVAFLHFFAPDTWALDQIIARNGVVTIDGAGSNTIGSNTFIELLTGDADLDVDGGHLIFRDSPVHSLTIDVGSFTLVREGILELQSRSKLNSSGVSIGTTAGGLTGELFIAGGSFVDTGPGFANSIGLNGSTGIVTIQSGSATFAGETRMAQSGTAGTGAQMNVSGSSILNVDSLRMGGTVAGADASITLADDATMTVSGASTMNVGNTAGAGVINIQDDAFLDTGTGTITVNTPGHINLAGGTLQADGLLDFQGGRLDMTGGELHINNGIDAITGGGVFNFTGGIVRVNNGLARLESSLDFGGPSDVERANVIVENGNDAEVEVAYRIGNSPGTFGRTEVRGVGSSLVGTNGGAGADLIVGEAGDGELEVIDGGFVSFRDDFIIAGQAGSRGTALIQGEIGGTRSTVQVTIGGTGASISVGQAGDGVLTIENAALVENSGDVFLAAQATGNATVHVGNPGCGAALQPSCTFEATLQAGDDIWVGGGSVSAGGTAMLNVNDEGLVIVPDLMRIYPGGTVNLDQGRIELGTLDVQGGTLNFLNGELNFSGSATLDSNLITAISGVSGTHNNGLISAVNTLTIDAPFTNDTVSSSSEGVTADTLNVNAAFSHGSGRVIVDTLNLTAPYTLDGGRLTIVDGTNLGTNLNVQSGILTLNGAALNIQAGGLLGATPSFTGGTVENNGATLIGPSGVLQIAGGTFKANTTLTVENGGHLLINSGNVDVMGSMSVENGSIVTNSDDLDLFNNLVIQPGGTFTNVGATDMAGSSTRTLSGSIDNQGTFDLPNSTVTLLAAGLTLTGGGNFRGDSSGTSVVDGNDTAVVNNVDNILSGRGQFDRLELRDLQLDMGTTAVIGNHVDLINVDLTGGSISGAGVILSSSTTIDDTVNVSGGLGILSARVLPGAELRLQGVVQLSVSATTLDLDGRLRAEAGASVLLATPGTYDWTDGIVSLADDVAHQVDIGATIVLNSPLEYDNIAVDDTTLQFHNAVFGANPVIGVGQEMQVASTTTLNGALTIDGGKLTTGTLVNYEQLDFRAGEFQLTEDDFQVEPGAAGPFFVVPAGAMLTVDNEIKIEPGSRLIATSGVVQGGTLANSGDFDFIEAIATITGAAINRGDINAIDSTLSFIGGLTSTGQLNLINTVVNGSITLGGDAGLSGDNTFNGALSGAGKFTGDGNVKFTDVYAPGASPAGIPFGGDVTFDPTASLQIEIGGLTAGSEFDSLNIAGMIDLSGSLNVSLINGFLPSVGALLEIITSTSVLDMFEVEDLPNIGGLLWDVSYNPTSVVLSVFSPFTADFDLDGDVDGVDLNDPVDGWQARYGTDLDGGNFLDWQRQLGSDVLPPSASSTVPEPLSIVLLLILGAAGALQRRM